VTDVVGTALVNILPNTAGFRSALAAQITPALAGVQAQAAGISGAFTAAGASMTAMGSRLGGVGRTLNRNVTTPLLLLGAGVIHMGLQFEDAMLNVRAVSGASADEFTKLNDRAKELGITTKFTASEVAEGMGFMAMAGFEVNEIYAGIPGVLDLAAAGNLDLGRAADLTTNILTGYGLEVEQLSRVNDVLAKTFTSSNTNMEQLGIAFSYVGPVAAAAGLEFEEVAAALGLLGNAGMQAERGGAALRNILTRLLDPRSDDAREVLGSFLDAGDIFDEATGKMMPLADIIEAMEGRFTDLGIELTDTSGNLLDFDVLVDNFTQKGLSMAESIQLITGVPLDRFLTENEDAFAQLGISVRNSGGAFLSVNEIMDEFRKGGLNAKDAMNIFQQRAGPAFAGLVAQGSGALRELTEQNRQASGTAQTIAEIQMSGLRGSLRRMKAAFEGVAIAISESGVFDVLGDFIDSVTGAVRGLVELNPEVFKWGAAILLIIGSIGPLLAILGLWLKSMGFLATAFGFLLSPIGLVVAAVAGFIALLVLAYQNSEGFREQVDRVAEVFTGRVVPALKEFGETFVKWFVDEAIPAVQDFASSVGDSLAPALETAVDFFANISEQFGNLIDSLGDGDAQGIGEVIDNMFGNTGALVEPVREFVEVIQSFFNALGGGELDEGASGFATFANDLGTALRNIIGFIRDEAIPFIIKFKEQFLFLGLAFYSPVIAIGVLIAKVEPLRDLFMGFVGWLNSTALPAIRDGFVGALDALSVAWDNIFPTLRQFAEMLRDDVWPALQAIIAPIGENLMPLLEAFRGLWDAILPVLLTVAVVVGGALYLAFQTLIDVLDFVMGILRPIGEFIGDVLNVAFEALISLVNILTDVIDGLVDVFQGLWDIISGLISLDPGKMFDGLKQAGSGILAILKGVFLDLPGLLGDAIAGLATAIWNFLTETLFDLLGDIGGFLLDLFKAGFDLFVEGIPLALGAMAEVGGMILGGIADGATAAFDKLGDVASGIWDALVNFFTDTVPAVYGWFTDEFIPGVLGKIGEVVSGIPGALLGLVEALLAGFFAAFDVVLNALADFVLWFGAELSSLVGKIGPWLSELPGKLGDAFQAAADWVREKWDALWEFVTTFFSELPEKVGNWLSELPEKLGDAFQAAADWVREKWDALWEFVTTFFSELPGKIGNWLSNAGETIWNGIVATFEWLKTKLSDFWDSTVEFAKALPGRIMDALSTAGETIWNGIVATFEWLKTKLSDYWDSIYAFASELPGRVGEALSNFGTTVWNSITGGLTTLKDNVVNKFTDMKDALVGDQSDSLKNKIIDGIMSIPDALGGFLTSMIDKLRAPFDWFAKNVWNPFANTLNDVAEKFGLGRPLSENVSFETRHSGGVIGDNRGGTHKGPIGDDEQMTIMQRGEGVIPVDAMRKMSIAQFEALRSGNLSQMASMADSGQIDGTFDPRDQMGGFSLGDLNPISIGKNVVGAVGDFVDDNLRRGAAAIFRAAVSGTINPLLNQFDGLFGNTFMGELLVGGVRSLLDDIEQWIRGAEQAMDERLLSQLGTENYPVGYSFGGGPALDDTSGLRSAVQSMAGRDNSYPALVTWLIGQGIPFIVTSTIRNTLVNGTTKPSLHNSGRAVDLVGPNGGVDNPELLRIYNGFSGVADIIRSRIYSGPGGGGYGAVGSLTYQDHHDHVHAALARGGFIRKPTFALLGEDGGDELVLPFNDPDRALQLALSSGLFELFGESSAARSAAAGTRSAPGTLGAEGPSTVVNNDITVVGVSFDQALNEIQARQNAQLRSLRR